MDERARAQPTARAAGAGWPMRKAMAAISPVQSAICSAPRPNTSRRISRSRSHDSSSPIMNSRKTTPYSASSATSAGRETVISVSQGRLWAAAPRP